MTEEVQRTLTRIDPNFGDSGRRPALRSPSAFLISEFSNASSGLFNARRRAESHPAHNKCSDEPANWTSGLQRHAHRPSEVPSSLPYQGFRLRGVLIRLCSELAKHERIVGELALPVAPKVNSARLEGGRKVCLPSSPMQGSLRRVDARQRYGVLQNAFRFRRRIGFALSSARVPALSSNGRRTGPLRRRPACFKNADRRSPVAGNGILEPSRLTQDAVLLMQSGGSEPAPLRG